MTPLAKEFAQRILDAYFEGKDDLIRDLHLEIRNDYELYQAIWSHFYAPLRRDLKRIVGEMRIEARIVEKKE